MSLQDTENKGNSWVFIMKVVCLTGAGISAESGISTFRASDGLWENHCIEDVATPEGFSRNANLVYNFYNQRRSQLQLPSIQPNAAHEALADLADSPQHSLTLVTQNVDNLHEKGGCREVIHMHGELLKARCVASGRVFSWHGDLTSADTCECCSPPQKLRPHIVWFGEMPFAMEEIEKALYECDLFIAIGTSGQVYPAAGFVALAKQFGAKTVLLNLEELEGSHDFDEHIYGKASEIVPEFVQKLLKQ